MAVLIFASTDLILPSLDLGSQNSYGEPLGFHVGVSFGGNTTTQAELLIDKVKSYTNLFVVQSGPVSV